MLKLVYVIKDKLSVSENADETDLLEVDSMKDLLISSIDISEFRIGGKQTKWRELLKESRNQNTLYENKK